MAGTHDSTHIRVPRVLKARLESLGTRLLVWANENIASAPDYFDNPDHVAVDVVILHLLEHYERKKRRVRNSRAARSARRKPTGLVVPAEEGRNGSCATQVT